MSRPRKTREQIASQFYLNKSDIMKLFGCSFENSKRIFDKADEEDDKELPFRLEPLKVRKQTVLRLAGISSTQLERTIQNEVRQNEIRQNEVRKNELVQKKEPTS